MVFFLPLQPDNACAFVGCESGVGRTWQLKIWERRGTEVMLYPTL